MQSCQAPDAAGVCVCVGGGGAQRQVISGINHTSMLSCGVTADLHANPNLWDNC
jgi:hypothetical protein